MIVLGLMAMLLWTSTASMQNTLKGILTEAAILPYWAKLMLTTGLIASCLLPTTLAALLWGGVMGYEALAVVVPAIGFAIVLHYLFFGLMPYTWRDYLVASPKAKAMAARFERGGAGTLFFLRLSPLFPFALTNLMLRFFRFRLWEILVGSLLGIMPRTILSVAVGFAGVKLLGALGHYPWAVGIALAAISVVGLWWVLRKGGLELDTKPVISASKPV